MAAHVMNDPPDARLHAFKATDVILAALQTAFAQEKLFNGGNPLRFNRDDPKNSRVWVCDPESRQDTREGNRQIVMVTRGEYAPQEHGLANFAGQGLQVPGTTNFSDLGMTPITVICEAGNKASSETLASIVYSVLKIFRLQLMEEYDIHSIKFNGISAPSQAAGMPGNPWVTMVSMRVETQERLEMRDLGNQLNSLQISESLAANAKRVIASLDATVDGARPIQPVET